MQFVSGEWVTNPVVERTQPVQERTEKRMVAVLPFIPKELEQVKSFLRRSNQLAGQIPRTIFLLPFKGIDTSEIRKEAEAAFSQVGFILDSEGVTSDWQGRQQMRSAAGPNSLFRQAAWHFYLKKIGPWLWLEPDCWPQTERWFYDLEREYFDAMKPFMGVKMGLPSGNEYVNGVAVYPWNAIQYAPLLVQSSMWEQHPEMEVGFDIAGGQEVLQKTHVTRKIQLMGPLARGNAEVRPETVLCHGRIDLSGGATSAGNGIGSSISVAPSEMRTEAPTQKPFLGRYGVARDAQTEVLDETSHAARCVPSHETPAQESIEEEYRRLIGNENTKRIDVSSQSKNGGSEYGGVSTNIKRIVNELVEAWDQQPHRKVLIVKELRKAKLVPKHFR